MNLSNSSESRNHPHTCIKEREKQQLPHHSSKNVNEVEKFNKRFGDIDLFSGVK